MFNKKKYLSNNGLILCWVIFFICSCFSTSATSQTRIETGAEEMNSSLMYAIIKTAEQGKKVFNKKLAKKQASCGTCHIKRNFPQIIGKRVNRRTIAAIQHCYYAYMDSHKAIPEETLNYILVYLLSAGRSTQKNQFFSQ